LPVVIRLLWANSPARVRAEGEKKGSDDERQV